MIIDPDGLTLVINGWSNYVSSPYQYGIQLACIRLVLNTQDPSVKPQWKTLWTSEAWPETQGRLAIYAAPRIDGSIIVGGWNGLYRFHA
jgi:hypothetical protein